MHLPETGLFPGGLRRPSEELRAGMRAFVREMPEDIGELLPEGLPQSGDHRPKPTAIRTEIVAINHHLDAVGGVAAADVIAATLDRTQKRRLL